MSIMSTNVGPVTAAEKETAVVEALAQARATRAEGDRDGSVAILKDAIQSGLWRYARLWTELRSLMQSPQDYEAIRELWWSSPRGCHGVIPLLTTIARAASVAGQHDEARLLLRKAIILQALRGRQLRRRLGELKHETVQSIRGRSNHKDDGSFESKASVALSELNETLDKLNVRGFLISGTLLGYVRDSAFISWDKDIDLGFFTSEISVADLESAFDHSSKFNIRRIDFNTERLRINHENGTMIDVFPHYLDTDDKVWHDGTATRWWNSPFELKTIDFLGKPQYVPDPPEQYLDENYGQWQMPEPNFDARLDAPNAQVTDQPFLDTLTYFALLDALKKRNPVKLERYRKLLIELGEGDWLDRL